MLSMLGLAVVNTGCTRADVYAITDEPATDGGGDLSGEPAVCPSPALLPGNTSQMLPVNSVSRSYVLHIPPTYDGSTPVPLIIDFHALGSTGLTESLSSPYPEVTDPEGVVMAFPDGLKGPAGNAWDVGPCCVANVDDVEFATTLVGEIEKTACIDRSRVYAVGVSTGGGMANYVACHAANVFAAVAPAGFAFLEGTNVDDCNPLRPITVISFRGTAEVRVLYDGGSSSLVPGMPVTFLSAKATFERWAQIDRCNGLPSDDSNGCSRYADCQDGVEVFLCTKQGGGEEPGDPTVAWPVLKRYTLPP
jgi:polyhydroxybutyrate depolymerase